LDKEEPPAHLKVLIPSTVDDSEEEEAIMGGGGSERDGGSSPGTRATGDDGLTEVARRIAQRNRVVYTAEQKALKRVWKGLLPFFARIVSFVDSHAMMRVPAGALRGDMPDWTSVLSHNKQLQDVTSGEQAGNYAQKALGVDEIRRHMMAKFRLRAPPNPFASLEVAKRRKLQLATMARGGGSLDAAMDVALGGLEEVTEDQGAEVRAEEVWTREEDGNTGFVDYLHGRVLLHATDDSGAAPLLCAIYLIGRLHLPAKDTVQRLKVAYPAAPHLDFMLPEFDSLHEAVLQRKLARQAKRLKDLRLSSLAGI
jgi:hypothetical protein